MLFLFGPSPGMYMTTKARLLRLSPRRIAGGYLVFGVLWILLSDWVVSLAIDSQANTAQIQTMKGWLFVVGSAALIFGLTKTREAQVESTNNRLRKASEELQVLQRVFRHNIRNDLNVVVGRIDLVRESIEDTQYREWLATANNATERVLDTSEKLRIIGKTNASSTNLGTVDVVEILESEAERFESTYPDSIIVLDLPEAAMVTGDHSLRHVFRELFENAMEHHDLPEDQRRLSISVDRSVSEVVIRVADNGPGIPENELSVFQREKETQLSHSNGVGIWLVKWLCSFCDGSVEFESGSTEGTVVMITLPSESPVEGVKALVGESRQIGAGE